MWHNQNCFKSSLYTLYKGVKVSRYDFIIIQMSFEDIKTIVHGHEWTSMKDEQESKVDTIFNFIVYIYFVKLYV